MFFQNIAPASFVLIVITSQQPLHTSSGGQLDGDYGWLASKETLPRSGFIGGTETIQPKYHTGTPGSVCNGA